MPTRSLPATTPTTATRRIHEHRDAPGGGPALTTPTTRSENAQLHPALHPTTTEARGGRTTPTTLAARGLAALAGTATTLARHLRGLAMTPTTTLRGCSCHLSVTTPTTMTELGCGPSAATAATLREPARFVTLGRLTATTTLCHFLLRSVRRVFSRCFLRSFPTTPSALRCQLRSWGTALSQPSHAGTERTLELADLR
jgi:hypothetical protein